MRQQDAANGDAAGHVPSLATAAAERVDGRAGVGNTDQPAVPSSRLAATLIILAGIAAAFQIGKVPVAISDLEHDFGVGLRAAGAYMAIFAVCAACGGAFAGAIAARWGLRRTFQGSQLVLGVAVLAGAFAPNFQTALVGRIVEGLAFLFVYVAGSALLKRVVAPRHLRSILAVWSCCMPLGICLAMALFPYLGGWRRVWIVNAAAILIVWAANRAVAERDAAIAATRPIGTVLAVFTLPGPLRLAAMFSCYNVAFYAVVSFLPLLLQQTAGFDVHLSGASGALSPAANVFGNLAAGWLMTKPGTHVRPVLLAGFAVMGACGVAIFLGALPPGPTLLLAAAFGAFSGLIPATLFATMPSAMPDPEQAPAGFGLLMQGSNLGLLISPVLVGTIVDTLGWPGGAFAVGLVSAAGMGFALTSSRRDERAPAA